MRSASHIDKRAMILSLWLGLLLLPTLAEAIPISIQTSGNHTVTNKSSFISVLVTNPIDGTPIANLGDTIPSGLPPGWTLRFAGTTPVDPPLCALNSTASMSFSNLTAGIYIIHNPVDCTNNGHELNYVIEIDKNVGPVNYRGSGLGVNSRGP
jgi:hypothetical protein